MIGLTKKCSGIQFIYDGKPVKSALDFAAFSSVFLKECDAFIRYHLIEIQKQKEGLSVYDEKI